jgi:hypothetical protein
MISMKMEKLFPIYFPNPWARPILFSFSPIWPAYHPSFLKIIPAFNMKKDHVALSTCP